jgi:helix-turn-helix protein
MKPGAPHVFIIFDEERRSDSPFVDRVWRCHSEGSGRFLAVASVHWEMVVSRVKGDTMLTLLGPNTQAREVFCPDDGEWWSVQFRPGTFMPATPVGHLINGRDVTLPQASGRSFLLNGSKWEYPSFDNLETFVARLAKAGVIARDSAVEAVLHGDERALSQRSAQRHFRQATGITHTMLRQIERARHATNLLRSGVSIADAVHEAGYFDHAHLTRSLRRFIGITPTQIARAERQLSFLYKTTPPV